MADSTQVAVVGAGLVGSAAAFHLARRGVEVVLLERTRPAAPDGSSHGSARIFRYAYDDPFWVRLVQRAAAGYAELERLSGQTLLTPTGSLDRGALRRPQHLADVLAECGIDHALLTAAEARDRWPHAVDDAETGPALWHPGAAVLDAERVVAAQVALAEQHGARLITGWELAGVEAHGAGQRLTSTDGRVLDAGAVVVAAGGWLPHLLGRLGLPASALAGLPPLEVSQEQAFHFPYAQQDGDGAAPWPTTIHHTPEALVYSLPGGRDAGHRGQKVAQMNGGRRIASAVAQDGAVDPANRELVTRHVRRHLPGLVPEPYAETTCLFTSTPTEDFVVDRVRDGVVVVSACSGHGAKLAPVVGELAADVVLGGEPLPRFRARSITV